MWADDGPGWERCPQIKAALKPIVADNGIFWVSHKEFYRYFHAPSTSAQKTCLTLSRTQGEVSHCRNVTLVVLYHCTDRQGTFER